MHKPAEVAHLELIIVVRVGLRVSLPPPRLASFRFADIAVGFVSPPQIDVVTDWITAYLFAILID